MHFIGPKSSFCKSNEEKDASEEKPFIKQADAGINVSEIALLENNITEPCTQSSGVANTEFDPLDQFIQEEEKRLGLSFASDNVTPGPDAWFKSSAWDAPSFRLPSTVTRHVENECQKDVPGEGASSMRMHFEENPERQFRDAARAAGIELPNKLEHGKLYRFNPETGNKKSRNNDGWCVFYSNSNGISAGAFGDWSRSINENWSSKANGRDWTDDERRAHAKAIEAAKKAREQEKLRYQKKVAKETTELREACKLATASHPYLESKGIQPHGIFVTNDGLLIVPLHDENLALHSRQSINAGGDKSFPLGGRVAGLFHLIGEIDPEGELAIGEGFATMAAVYEACGIPAIAALSCSNLLPVGQALRKKYPRAKLIFCADHDAWTVANPGENGAIKAAQAVGGKVAVPQFKDLRSYGASDFCDLRQAEGDEAVLRCLKAAKDPPVVIDLSKIKEAIARLAELSVIEYQTVRKDEASKLNVKVAFLDEEVKTKRKHLEEAEKAKRKTALWPHAVDGSVILTELIKTFEDYVVMPEHERLTAALWTLHTHAHDAFMISPYLAAVSPEPGCGKTTLLSLLQELAANALSSASISGAAVYRAIDQWKPTLVLDEADKYLGEREELQGIINSAHNRRLAYAVRCVEEGKLQIAKKFSTWTPIALAWKGDGLPDTIRDRSIGLKLRKKLPSEKTSRFRADKVHALETLNRKMVRWAVDNLEKLRKSDAEVPEQIVNDRHADNWRTLLAIADIIGGDWPEKARKAAITIEAGKQLVIEQTVGVRLLADIRRVFDNNDKLEGLSAKSIIEKIVDFDENPWAFYANTGRYITTTAFAKLLSTFDITSKRKTYDPDKGRMFWYKDDFKDAWDRYLPNEAPF